MTEKKKKEENKKKSEIAEAPSGHDKQVRMIMWIFIGLLVVFVLFALFYEGNTYEYKSPSGEIFQFQKMDIGGHTLHTLTVFMDEEKGLHQVNMPMWYGPKEVKDIKFDENVIKKIKSYGVDKGWIYFTIDPNESSQVVIARNEVSRLVGKSEFGILGIDIYGAFTSNISTSNLSEEGTDYPFKTCKDAFGKQGVIWFSIGNQTRVYTNKCIIVEGTTYEELIRASDRLAYGLLGVM